eukprot:m.62152 g.62152  ORF g.62152 m.62152 type:complete len:325 (+) comp13920_c0_seq1:77-1051(+)
MPPRAKRKGSVDGNAGPSAKKEKPEQAAVKDEPIADLDQDRVLEYLKESGKANDGNTIGKALGMELVQVTLAAQALINTGKVMIKNEMRDGKLVVVFEAADELFERVAHLSKEETLVYNVIEAAGSKGIWHRELKPKTNLETRAINTIIKRLIKDEFIQTVKSVAASKKRLYMLFGLEPDVELTGGPWYAEDEFDADFVDALRKLAIKHLMEKSKREYDTPMLKYQASFASAQDILDFIVSTKITTQKLTLLNIERMMDTLVHDRTASVKINHRGRLYKISRMPAPKPALQLIPCGVCKVRRNCAPGAAVSPEGCQYLKEWADF